MSDQTSRNVPMVSGNAKSNRKKSGSLLFMTGVLVSISFGWVAFPYLLYRESEQPIQFSHRAHTGDNVGLKCEECHEFDADGTFRGIPGIEECARCHSKPAGVSDEDRLLREKYIIPGREIPWVAYSRQPQNVFFSHAIHVKRGRMDCMSCHFGHEFTGTLRPAWFSRISGYGLDVFGSNIFNAPYTPSRGMRMDDCSDCHKKRGVKESCVDCHK